MWKYHDYYSKGAVYFAQHFQLYSYSATHIVGREICLSVYRIETIPLFSPTRVLAMCHSVLYKQLSAWMLHGLLLDEQGEFFIEAVNEGTGTQTEVSI